MRTVAAALALALALPAGAGTPPPAAPATRKGAVKRPSAPAAPERLPFVTDDYQTALAAARARNVPLVVDVWAPW